MRNKSAQARINKIAGTSIKENAALEVISQYARVPQTEIIRRGIELAIEEYSFLLKDCDGVILSEEVAKRLA